MTPSDPPPHRPDDDQPSEFLTPVHPFETIEPEGGEPVPGGGGGPFRRPSNAILAAIVVVVLVAAGIVVASTAQRNTGPPGAPGDLTAAVAVCATECERIQAVVTLSWSSADGRVDHYMVERDGEQKISPAPSKGSRASGYPGALAEQVASRRHQRLP